MPAPGSEKITDQMVQAALEGSQIDRDFILSAMSAPLRAMVAARLAPTGPQSDVIEELAQECAVALCDGLKRLRSGTATSLRSFASQIVAHKVADRLRRTIPAEKRMVSPRSHSSEQSSANATMDIFSAEDPSPRSAYARAEAHDQILAELGRLKPEHREVITLAFYDQLSLGEIADRLELTKAAASMLLFRALKTVRKSITGHSRVRPAHDRPR